MEAKEMEANGAHDVANMVAETSITQTILASKQRAQQTAQQYDPRVKEFMVSCVEIQCTVQ